MQNYLRAIGRPRTAEHSFLYQRNFEAFFVADGNGLVDPLNRSRIVGVGIQCTRVDLDAQTMIPGCNSPRPGRVHCAIGNGLPLGLRVFVFPRMKLINAHANLAQTQLIALAADKNIQGIFVRRLSRLQLKELPVQVQHGIDSFCRDGGLCKRSVGGERAASCRKANWNQESRRKYLPHA